MIESIEDPPQIAEVGGKVDGEPVTLDRRMFVQLLAFGGCRDAAPALDALTRAEIPAVVYLDANDPDGIGVAVAYEAPERLITELRPVLTSEPFSGYTARPEYTMFGRTYAIGYERDLEQVLIEKPLSRLTDPHLQWSVWYPLRRRGVYETLSPEEKHAVQTEHMRAGIAFARAGHIADIRLACHGLGMGDNDFVLGLFGANLHRLSLVVQVMRKSTQTSTYIEKMGPFFVGHAFGRTPVLATAPTTGSASDR